MRLLLDTHAVIWMLREPGALSPGVRALIETPESQVWVSSVSIWELAIKEAKGKLRIGGDVRRELAAERVDELAIEWRHAHAAGTLPPHHHDPFDRMLVAQAQLGGMSIVTDDAALSRYDVHVVPAR